MKWIPWTTRSAILEIWSEFRKSASIELYLCYVCPTVSVVLRRMPEHNKHTFNICWRWLRRWRIHLQYRRPEFDPWIRKIPWKSKWQPTPVLLPGKSHGQRSLVGYSPRGHKESDTTQWLNNNRRLAEATPVIISLQQPYSSGKKNVSTSFFWIYLNTLKDENVLELHMHLKSEGVLVQIIAESFSLPFFLCRGRELSNPAVQAKTNSIWSTTDFLLSSPFC